MVVFDPVKIVITNYSGAGEWLDAENNPEDENAGSRKIKFSREVLIEKEDFMENPPKKYFRLAPGQMVRLKGAYIIKCESIIKDDDGNVTEIHCTYIPESRSGNDTSGIHVKGTLHWVSASDYVEVELREYDRLFSVEDPASEAGDFKEYLNPDSLNIIKGFAEVSICEQSDVNLYQFLRKGYYAIDNESDRSHLIFNRTVGLKDGWKPKNQ